MNIDYYVKSVLNSAIRYGTNLTNAQVKSGDELKEYFYSEYLIGALFNMLEKERRDYFLQMVNETLRERATCSNVK